MRTSAKIAVRLAVGLSAILLPLIIFAADANTNASGNTNSNLSGGAAVAMTTPLGGTSLETFIGKVVRLLLGFTGMIALVMFIWGGFQWMTAGGNLKQVEKAKNTLVWATIGLVVIFTSYSVVRFILQTLEKGQQ